jgi:hypothetical protein
MPENETPSSDGRSANRLRPICERMNRGESPVTQFPNIQDELYTRLQRAWRQWKACSVDPCELFAAATGNQERFDTLIRRTNNNAFAQLLRDVARSLDAPTISELVRAFLSAVWDIARDEMQIDCRDDGQSPEFVEQVDAMLERMARLLLGNLSNFPPRPRRTGPPKDLDSQLGDNLLDF